MKCLYNGVGPLPDIHSVYTPELQAKCPNACIVYYETQGLYRLYASPVPGYVYWIVLKGEFVSLGDGLPQFFMAELDTSSSEWVDKSPEYTDPETSGGYSANFDVKNFVWSNHDIYYPDDYSHDPALAGTLKFAASDPVPVSPVQINPALLVQSFFAGQAVRRMRGKPVAHTHAYTPVVTVPTCTEKGFTTYTCACGDSYTAEETEALGHDYVSEVIAPTTETEGYTIHTCSRCGDSYKDNYTEKLKLVGYSYNGNTFPDINTGRTTDSWNAFIVHNYEDKILLYRTSALEYNTKYDFYYVGMNDKWYYVFELQNGTWKQIKSDSGKIGYSGELLWCLVDVTDQTTGEIFMYGSDPVPVYE